MRVLIGQPYAVRETRTATAQPALMAEREHRSAPAVTAVWQSALTIFVLRAPAILLITCVCIAGPAILGLLVYAALGLDTFVHMSGPLATWEAIMTLRSNGGSAVVIGLGLQAGLGAIGLAFARGMIARLALSESDAEDAASLSLAYRAAKACFPSLLVGSLIYGAFVTCGAVGINGVLRDTGFDLRLVGRRDVTAPAQTLALRALDAFVPNSGSPFAEIVPLLRHSSFANTTREGESNQYWQYVTSQVQSPPGNTVIPVIPVTPVEESSPPMLAISLASLGALLLAEALLRFTPIMAMNAGGRPRLGVITPVLHSIRFGIRHFGSITWHVWLLRLAFVASYGLFFILPIVVSQDGMPVAVTSVTKSLSFMGSGSVALTLACHSLITALFTAFSTVYDARLVMQHHSFGANLAQATYDSYGSVNPLFPEVNHEKNT